jgi:UDP-N-acetyl-D-mannosaminuronic acid dehydrogenase
MINLIERVKNNDFTLGVVGMGRVGLPLALVFAQSGVRVIGIDKDEDYVEKLKRGEKPFHEAGIEELLSLPNFTPTTKLQQGVRQSDILILCVGTPLTQGYNPDYSQLYSALSEIAEVPIEGKLIIIRSTVPPGTLEDRVVPFLEKKTDLTAGKDFGVAVCPERIVEGKAIKEIKELPEIIGGIDQVSIEIVAQLFTKINPNKRILKTTPKAAELTKLFSNIYRYVNFALANEFALLAEGFGQDGLEIINMLNDGYPRGGVPKPGLAGGPCLSKDGYFLLSNTAFPDFILLAWRLNEFIPQHIVNRLRNRLKEKGKLIHRCKIAVLGLAFKAGIDDTRYSPSVRIAELLESENASVAKHDPYIEATQTLESVVSGADAIILATNHPEFEGICQKIYRLGKHNPDCVLVDCWGMINSSEAKQCGFDYIRFGSGKD